MKIEKSIAYNSTQNTCIRIQFHEENITIFGIVRSVDGHDITMENCEKIKDIIKHPGTHVINFIEILNDDYFNMHCIEFESHEIGTMFLYDSPAHLAKEYELENKRKG